MSFEKIDKFIAEHRDNLPKHPNSNRTDWNTVKTQFPLAWEYFESKWGKNFSRITSNLIFRINYNRKRDAKNNLSAKFAGGANIAESYSKNGHQSRDMVRWTPEELTAIAEQFALETVDHPLENAMVRFEKAQRKVLPGQRQRSIGGLSVVPAVVTAIGTAWKQLMAKPAPAHVTVQLPPQISVVEVPRKLTVEEMLASMDEISLEALVHIKRRQREDIRDQALLSLCATANGKTVPQLPVFVPKLEIFESGTKKKPRIAVLGVPEEQFAILKAEAELAHLEAVLSCPNPKDSITLSGCDFAIVHRDKSNINTFAAGDKAVHAIGRDHVIFVENTEPATLLHQVRTICARQ